MLTVPSTDGEEGDRRRAPEISVVSPVYGCRDCLRALHERLCRSLESIVSDYEIVFVDDRSPDDAWPLLRELSAEDDRVTAIRLSRNFGQHVAITAGLAASRGRYVVVMDCDLQDPPEEIPALYRKIREGGYDVVLCRREERVQSLPRRLAAGAYFRAHNLLARGDLHTNYANLSMLSRKVVDSFLTLRDKDRQYLLILHWLGYNRVEIDIRQTDRHAGQSAYRFRELLKVAIDGLFFQTTVLLRLIIYAGFCLAVLGAALALYAVGSLAAGRHLPQWTALPMFALFLAAFIIISTGVTGLYVGKIFDQVKGRPLFVVDEIASGGRASAPARETDTMMSGAAFAPMDPPV